jgi:hypothetical protein
VSRGGNGNFWMLANQRLIYPTTKLANFSAGFAKADRCNCGRIEVLRIEFVICGGFVTADAANFVLPGYFNDEFCVRSGRGLQASSALNQACVCGV